MQDMQVQDFYMLRRAALWGWFVSQCPRHALGKPLGTIQDVSGDASFRRYFRGSSTAGSWILVDAPPDKEDSRPFLSVQAMLERGGVQVPRIVAADLQLGFMCQQDFGAALLWPALEQARLQQDLATAGDLYGRAFVELLKIQRCDAQALPMYDAALLQREVLLFRDWLCQQLLDLQLGGDELRLLDAVFALLIDAALAQPQVFVHRDYHSRNLMLLQDGIGVIDFQDAVQGPLSYDLVSLLKDCYIAWPAASVETWALNYLEHACNAGIAPRQSERAFLRSFHLMGMQRHLKAAGIFCRLWLRDGKPGYLQEIPRTLAYISALPRDSGLCGEFQDWLQGRVLPLLDGCVQNSLNEPRRESGT
jgi:aminoglycoside/choline kinase family phosphotransferase